MTMPESTGALSVMMEGAAGLLGRNAALVALSASFLESIIGVGVLFPGGTVVILSGYAARSMGAVGFLEVVFCAWLGMTVGASLDYWLGRVAGRRLVPRWAPWRLSCRWRHLLRKSKRFMDRWGWWAIAVANLAGPGRASIAVAAGASNWSFPRFLAGQSLAALAWSVLYCGMGYFLARGAQRAETIVSGLGIGMAVVMLLALAGPSLVGLLSRLAAGWFRQITQPAPQTRIIPQEATTASVSIRRR